MMIKKKIGVLAAAVVMASSANAAFDTGSAVLYAWDSATNDSYFVDLGVTGQDLVNSTTVNITDAGLGSWLGGHSGAQWSIIGTVNDTDKVGLGGLPPFLAGSLSLSNSGIVGTSANGSAVGGTGGLNASQQTILNDWISVIQGESTGSSFSVAGTNPAAADGARNGSGLNNSMVNIGSASALFYAQASTVDGTTLASGTTEISQVGSEGTPSQTAALLSSDGSFSVNTGAAVVPVPAAAWLFGSALAGLTVVRRRK